MNARRRNRSHGHQQNPNRSDYTGDRKRAQAKSQGLRHRADEIDLIVSDKCQNRAGAQDEHERDDGRGNKDGPADIARRSARLTRENGDVLKSAQRADRQFAEDIEAVKDRDRGRGELERVILLYLAARETD